MLFQVITNQTDFVFANNLSELLKGYSELADQNGFDSIDVSEITQERAIEMNIIFEDDSSKHNLFELSKDCKEFTILVEVE